MSTCPGPDCDRPAPRDATICRACTAALERNLGDVPAYVHELTVTLTRQDRIGGPGGEKRTKGADTPMPYHEGASEALAVLRSTLGGWVRVLVEDGAAWPSVARESRLAGFLLNNLDDLRQHEAADEAADEIAAALRLARLTVDRRKETWYAGPCGAGDEAAVPCPGELYAVPGADTVDCPDCGIVYQVAERRAYLLDVVEDQLVGASVMAAAVTTIGGVPLRADTVRKWAERGRIVAHAVTLAGHPLYRVGDVLDLAHGQRESVG